VVDARELWDELVADIPESRKCREPSDLFGHLLCGRELFHEGDHAELAAGHPQAVTIWPNQ
jgi:hypothetical protein